MKRSIPIPAIWRQCSPKAALLRISEKEARRFTGARRAVGGIGPVTSDDRTDPQGGLRHVPSAGLGVHAPGSAGIPSCASGLPRSVAKAHERIVRSSRKRWQGLPDSLGTRPAASGAYRSPMFSALRVPACRRASRYCIYSPYRDGFLFRKDRLRLRCAFFFKGGRCIGPCRAVLCEAFPCGASFLPVMTLCFWFGRTLTTDSNLSAFTQRRWENYYFLIFCKGLVEWGLVGVCCAAQVGGDTIATIGALDSGTTSRSFPGSLHVRRNDVREVCGAGGAETRRQGMETRGDRIGDTSPNP